MKTTITHNANQYQIDLSKPLDISIAITNKKDNVNAWYIDAPKIEPHRIRILLVVFLQVPVLTFMIFGLIRIRMVRILNV